MQTTAARNYTELTVELLSAFLANNPVRGEVLPALIASTHAALRSATATADEPIAAPQSDPRQPAVTVRKSLASRDTIISLIDGKSYKSLKRHLTRHGLTPDEYRSRYGLSASYPMVAPTYSEARREIAKRLGLGRKSPAVAVPST